MKPAFARWAAWGALGVWVSWLLFVALRLPFETWDGFEYIANARVLVGQGATTYQGYSILRPPLLALLLAPVQWGYQPFGASLWQNHLFAVGISTSSLLAAWALLRGGLSGPLAAVGAATVAINPITVHYAPFVLADVMSLGVTALALKAWLDARAKPAPWRFPLAGAIVGLAFATKYPLAVLPVSLVVFELVRAVNTRRLSSLFTPGVWLAGATCVVTFCAVWMLAGSLATPGYSVRVAIQQFQEVLRIAGDRYLDPWWEYFEELPIILGVPWLICIALGVVETLRARRDEDLLHLIWCAVFLFVMSRYIAHREARYLLPILPSLIWLGLRGAQQLWTLAPSLRPLRWVGAAVLLAVPAYRGFGEARRFMSPVYSKPVMAEAARFCAGMPFVIGGGRAWSLFTPDPVLFPNDEYFHFHHLSEVAFEYFAGRKRAGYEALQGAGPVAQIALVGGWWETMNVQQLPAMPPPFIVTVRRADGSIEQRKFGY